MGRPLCRRVGGKTMEQRVWSWVKRHDRRPTRTAIMEEFCLNTHQAKGVLDRLTDKGSLLAVPHGISYTATDVQPTPGFRCFYVWDWLRTQPHPVTSHDLCAHFKIRSATAKSIFRRLRDKGAVQQHKDGGLWVYVATETNPEDMRGTSLGSLHALLDIARKRRKLHKRKRRPLYKPTHALDAVWPSPVVKSVRSGG